MKFSTINSIDLRDDNTWNSQLFLTFDIDWAHDDVLADTIDIVEVAGVAATWFVTHDTPVLQRLRDNPKFELGLHPNFDFLLECDDRNGRTAEEVVDRLQQLVPEATSVRSHSLTQSSKLLALFQRKGLSHDCNHLIPEQVNMELKPWAMWNGMTRVPYFWEDDVCASYQQNTPVEKLTMRHGLKVFDFHPIHVFLNTEELSRYERTRSLHQKPAELTNHRCSEDGTRTILQKLLGVSEQ